MASASPSAPTTKKSFFKRPTWATSAPPPDSRDFFRHSDIVYDSILRDKERRREKHAQKKQAKAETEDVDRSRDTKRRRISTDEEDREEDSHSGSDTARSNEIFEATSTTKAPVNKSKSPARNLPARAGRETATNPESSTNITIPINSKPIELDSEDEASQPQADVPKAKFQARISDEEVSEEEDEYVLELKAKAREKARMKRLGIQTVRNPGQSASVSHPEQRLPLSSDTRPLFSQPQTAPSPPRNPDETIVQILITTRIPNSKDLRVNRRVSQPMQQVRQVWCARQKFSEEMTAQVIFTWRGKKLYDTTTSMHLLGVLKEERTRQMGGLADDDDDPSNGMIQVEAVTKDMYDQERLRKDQEGTEADAKGIGSTGVEYDPLRERSTTPKKVEYTIVMSAPGLETLHLKVRPSTSIAKIMAGFKKMRNVDLDKTCWLVFDGERLEPDSTVADTEIEDGDSVEVHVR